MLFPLLAGLLDALVKSWLDCLNNGTVLLITLAFKSLISI